MKKAAIKRSRSSKNGFQSKKLKNDYVNESTGTGSIQLDLHSERADLIDLEVTPLVEESHFDLLGDRLLNGIEVKNQIEEKSSSHPTEQYVVPVIIKATGSTVNADFVVHNSVTADQPNENMQLNDNSSAEISKTVNFDFTTADQFNDNEQSDSYGVEMKNIIITNSVNIAADQESNSVSEGEVHLSAKDAQYFKYDTVYTERCCSEENNGNNLETTPIVGYNSCSVVNSLKVDSLQYLQMSDVETIINCSFEKFKLELTQQKFVRVSEVAGILSGFLEKVKKELLLPYFNRINKIEKKFDEFLTNFNNGRPLNLKVFTFTDFNSKYPSNFPLSTLSEFEAFDTTLVNSSAIYKDLHEHFRSAVDIEKDLLLSLNKWFQLFFTHDVLLNYTAQRSKNNKLLFKSTNFYSCLQDALMKAFNSPGIKKLEESTILIVIGTIISNYSKDWNKGRDKRRKD